MGRQGAEILHRDVSKERGWGGREKKRKSRDLTNRSLKTDGETESGDPTYGSLKEEQRSEY